MAKTRTPDGRTPDPATRLEHPNPVVRACSVFRNSCFGSETVPLSYYALRRRRISAAPPTASSISVVGSGTMMAQT